jgi:CspA family cold shock protein
MLEIRRSERRDVSHTRRVPPMSKGKVKWFNDAKGYGFIEQTEGDDVFVHFSSIVGTGFRTLAEGETVEFDLSEADGRRQAVNVLRT